MKLSLIKISENIKAYRGNLFADSTSEVVQTGQLFDEQRKQWDKGKDREGKIIGLYSKATEIITKGRKKEGKPWNLFNTGELRREIYADIKHSPVDVTIRVDSESSTRNKLFNTILYRGLISRPETIFGLQDKPKEKFVNKIQKKAINNYLKLIRNGM